MSWQSFSKFLDPELGSKQRCAVLDGQSSEATQMTTNGLSFSQVAKNIDF
jgi:hypothetical protein